MINAWRTYLTQYHTLYVGLSGGLDSVALLHQLVQCPELCKKIVAVHVHHGLSPNADAWKMHCQTICTQWNIPLRVSHVEIDATHNIEHQARQARYQIFEAHIGPQDGMLLAHHRDDQAETFLLQLCRGSGVHGLAAMPAFRPLGQGMLIRPLLDYSRQSLHDYALQHHLAWVEDESNLNLDFARNYIRHQVIPLLQERWPNVVKNIADCSKLCGSAKKNLEYLADSDLKQVCHRILDISVLPLEDHDRLMNALYVWLKRNHVNLSSSDHLIRLRDEVILARPDATPMFSLGKVKIRRYRQKLYLLSDKHPIHARVWKDFPQPIQLDTKRMLYASLGKQGIMINTDSCIEVRTRQGGEQFQWHGQVKALKNLFQEWGIPPWERDQIPLIFVDNQLKMIVGHACADEKEVNAGQGSSMRVVIHLKEIVEEVDVTTLD